MSQEKYDLITRQLQEVVGEDDLKAILKERDVTIYWGTETSGRPHIGYFVPVKKIGDFLKAGCKVKILIADLHAYLNEQKAPWELLKLRTDYYHFITRRMLEAMNVPIDKLEFVQGTDFQLEKDYTLDMYRIAGMAGERDVKRAGSDVVKEAKNPKVSAMLYPILQALDEQYLDVDAQFGGVDQRKIFVFAREYLPKLGYKKRIHLMNPLVPGLTKDGKMSSSNEASKIDFLDTEKQVQKKINKAFAQEGLVEGNGLLAFLKHVICPMKEENNQPIVFERPERFGGDITYQTYEEIETAYANKELSPADLKPGVAKEINNLLAPIRKAYEDDKAMQEIIEKAYPNA